MNLWTTVCQAPLSRGFSREEYWSGLPCPPPGDLPNPGIKPRSPILQVDSLSFEPPGKPKHKLLLLILHFLLLKSMILGPSGPFFSKTPYPIHQQTWQRYLQKSFWICLLTNHPAPFDGPHHHHWLPGFLPQLSFWFSCFHTCAQPLPQSLEGPEGEVIRENYRE